MTKKLKSESDIFVNILTRPKDHPVAFVYLAMACVCLVGVVALNFIR